MVCVQIKKWRVFFIERKEIVKALGEFFGVEPKYMGVPSFAYQIETGDETYIIEREGSIKNSKGEELTLESILNPELLEPEIETEVIENPEILPIDGFELAIPFEDIPR